MKVALNLLLIAIAGGAAYFSFVQSTNFEKQQAIRLNTKKKEGDTAANAAIVERNLKDERAALVKSKEDLALVKSSIDTLKVTETSLKRDIATTDTELDGQKVKFAELEKAMADVNEILKGFGPGINIDNLGDEIVKMDEKLKANKAKVDELTTLIDAGEKKIVAGKAESKRLNDRAVESSARIKRNAMEAVVTAVNQDWGFLVIGAGSNSGFTPQTSLLVKRDGKLIGRVKPTAIEATQTIADIDLDSLADGVRIQPGDSVILAVPASN